MRYSPRQKYAAKGGLLLRFLARLPSAFGSSKLWRAKDVRPFRFREITIAEDEKPGILQDSEANLLCRMLFTGGALDPQKIWKKQFRNITKLYQNKAHTTAQRTVPRHVMTRVLILRRPNTLVIHIHAIQSSLNLLKVDAPKYIH